MSRRLAVAASLLAAATLSAQVKVQEGPGTLKVSTGAGPLVLQTAEASVTEGPKGTRVQGKVGIPSPLGMLDMLRTDVVFEYGPGGKAAGYQTFHGVSDIPFPGLGIFEGLKPASPVSAEITYRAGKDLGDLGVPLKPNQKYLAYKVRSGLGFEVGGMELAVPGGKEAVVVLDPFDPFFFVTGDLPGLDKIGKVEGVGIGLSAQGKIPFAPKTTWALPKDVPTFDGHLFLSGRVPLKQYSMAIQGETVIRLERGMSPIPGATRLTPTAAGGNGTLYLEVPLLEFTTFDMQLGTASAAAIWQGRRSAAYFSGVARPKIPFLPDELNMLPERELKVAGMIDAANPKESFLKGEGQYNVGLAKLAEKLNIQLDNLRETAGKLEISKRGVILKGYTRSQFSPLIKVKGGLDVDTYFSLKEPGKDFWVKLKGELGVGGIPLGAAASFTLGPKKAAISGAMQTPLTQIALSGDLGKGGIRLAGETGLKVDIKGLAKITQNVTNGAICGYEVVKDGAKCGFDQVTDSAVCGTKWVVDGGKCGFDWVTDGAVCGWTKVTDGAVCGWTKVTDGAVCGWTKVTDGAKCGWDWTKELINPLKWGKIKKPKTCQVARSCNKPRSCDQPRKCQKPKKCQIANTCQVARSCQDLSKPRTCPQVVTIPDFKLGSLEATIQVEVTQRGAGGSARGQYCATEGKCLGVGGKVKFDPKPSVCFDIPAVGERCFGF